MMKGFWYYIRRYGAKSIFARCALIILAVLVLPCTLFMSWIYSFYSGYMRNDIANAYLYSLEKSREALDIQLSEAKNLSDSLIYNTELAAFPKYAKMNRIDYSTLLGTVKIERDLSSALILQNLIDSIYVYYETVGLICSTKYGSKPVENFLDVSWLDEYDQIEADKRTHIIYRMNEEGKTVISLMRKNTSGENTFCTIINMDMDRLAEYMLNVNEELERVCLLDENGDVLYSEKGTQLLQGDLSHSIQNTVQLKTVPWTIVSFVSAETIEGQISTLNKWLYIGMGCILLIGVVVAAIISRWLYYALRILPDVLMDDLGTNEEYVEKANYGEVNEIVKTATEEKNALPAVLRRAQLNALQAQINPHFIYNTLDAISWRTISYLGDNNEVTEMIGKMADLMRMSMSQTAVITTLREEMECADQYVQIMQFRFRNRFEYRNEIDESFYSVSLPPFSLQPLIENAIIHGCKETDAPLHITVSVRKTEVALEVSVEDDGIGMTPEKLDELRMRMEKEKGKGLGLYNVQRRIHILFGVEYGLEIQSEYLKGTKMTIRLPKG